MKNMLEVIKLRDNKKVIGAMMEGRQSSIWSWSKEESEVELDFDNGIEVKFANEDYRTPVVRIEAFLNQVCDIDDDFAQEVNEVLYSLEVDDTDKVLEILNEKYDGELDDENGYMTGKGYTYNDSCNDLSRDFTYHVFEYEGDSYVFISIHYGADARWGFGNTVCFKIVDMDYFFMWDIRVYDSVTDEDFESHELESIADYDIETDEWKRKDNGNILYLNTVAYGF